MDTITELASRLVAGLNNLPAQQAKQRSAAALQTLADLSQQLQQHLTALPDDTQQLIHTADSGFPASGQWVDDAIAARKDNIKKLARATGMVATWVSPDGAAAERTFVIRGNIRGWAHRWRTEDKGPAQVDSDSDFMAFATDCLKQAGITENAAATIAAALGADWRTAPQPEPK
jgi:hypothetical protein